MKVNSRLNLWFKAAARCAVVAAGGLARRGTGLTLRIYRFRILRREAWRSEGDSSKVKRSSKIRMCIAQ